MHTVAESLVTTSRSRSMPPASPRFRRLVATLLQVVRKLAIRAIRVNDPWERLDATPALHAFGPGLRHDFTHFLTGRSRVVIGGLDDVLDWLLGCTYLSDELLFQEADVWQHPVNFERLRAGDCEDFALWSWRQLLALGVHAEFVTGRCGDAHDRRRHAWVVFRRDGREFLLESIARDRARMVRPLDEVRDRYLPEFGVGPTAERFSYAGWMLGAAGAGRRLRAAG